MSDAREYQRGYQAGRKRRDIDAEEIKLLRVKLDSRKDDIYMKCLELSLKYCGNWKIGKEPINNVGMYCKLAKIFLDNSISEIDS